MRVAIIGGGLSGLSTALIFKHLLPKYHIKLFEKSSRICSPSSLYLGLWNPTYKIFHDLNLYEEIKPMIQPIRLFQYYNQSSQLLFESSSLNISPNHPSFGYINQDILIQYLYEKVHHDVQLNSNVTKVYRNHTEAVIEFDNQEPYHADFVIAADGFNSITRRTVSGLDSIPQKSRGYMTFRGHSSNHHCENYSQILGVGAHFTKVPTLNGVAWTARVSDTVLNNSKHSGSGSSSTIDTLINIFNNHGNDINTLIQHADGGSDGIVQDNISQSVMNYQGWDAILKYQNGTTAPSPDDPLFIQPTAIEDAKKMGYVPSDSSQEASPGNVKKISYREALANGMWRVRTAPLVFYIGDAAYHMDPILLQGAGLGIEGAYRLAKTIKDSKFSDQLSTENDRTRSIDFDELMPDLMECENQRYFRYLRLKRLTTIMNLLQETNSLYVSQMRDKFCQLTPNTVKRSLVDTMIDKSLYY